jgi:hypothetical protein
VPDWTATWVAVAVMPQSRAVRGWVVPGWAEAAKGSAAQGWAAYSKGCIKRSHAVML